MTRILKLQRLPLQINEVSSSSCTSSVSNCC